MAYSEETMNRIGAALAGSRDAIAEGWSVRTRFVAAYDAGDSYLDRYETKKLTLYGVVAADLGDRQEGKRQLHAPGKLCRLDLSLRRRANGEQGKEQTGSQSYVPPEEKDDKALNMALELLRGTQHLVGRSPCLAGSLLHVHHAAGHGFRAAIVDRKQIHGARHVGVTTVRREDRPAQGERAGIRQARPMNDDLGVHRAEEELILVFRAHVASAAVVELHVRVQGLESFRRSVRPVAA